MDNGRLEDVMRMAVPTPKPPMSGGLRLQTKFKLPPGGIDVIKKLQTQGTLPKGVPPIIVLVGKKAGAARQRLF